MTKRKLADHFRNASLERARSPDFIPDGGMVCRELEHRDPYVALMYRGPDIRCFACRSLIDAGQTFFASTGCTNTAPLLCHHCGISWEIYKRRLSPDQAAAIPAYGGPV